MNRDTFEDRVGALVRQLYPDAYDDARTQLVSLADRYRERIDSADLTAPDHGTAVLITYGDAIRSEGEAPLATLHRVLNEHVDGVLTDVHILPMFPYTSDDGYAVVDYLRINPDLGDWSDIKALSADYGLMFDFVANHVSSQCSWFTKWLAGDSTFDGYFTEYDEALDTSNVVRPRTSPLFHTYLRADGGSATVWTTFSDDQVDINVGNIPTLVEMTRILLEYLARGAEMIRLDAIGFLWKESGTTCMHLPQTHAVVKLWRAFVDYLEPGAQIITETNVPLEENLSYFGNGSDEAHVVYQFGLPPVVLHTFVSGDAAVLSDWVATIEPVSDAGTYFNFLASHDGIGLRGSTGILDDHQRAAIVQRVLDNGGAASMKSNPDGTESVYELNINYLDALASPDEFGEDTLVASKGLAAHAIMCSMIGVPAIYYHSLFGSASDVEGMRSSGINRRINREVLDAASLVAELDSSARRRLVFEGIKNLLKVRAEHPAFSPFQPQQVERLDQRVFGLRRGMGTEDEVLCLVNVTDREIALPTVSGTDLLSGTAHDGLVLPGYGYVWLQQS